MKLAGARIAAFLGAPDPAMRAVLAYGPDQGLVRERADRIAAAIVPDRNDPFRIAELTGEGLATDPARLDDEARSLSLMPGRRVVRVRAASDAAGALFERFFAAVPPGDSLILVEAGDLGARSSLRRAFEAAKPAVAIACYPDSAEDLKTLVREVVATYRIKVGGEALDYLASHLGGDRMLSRQEIEKLALYAGDGGTIGFDEARAIVGDSAEITLDDALHAAASGDGPALERCLARAFDEGEAPVTVLRAALRHFQRLYLASARVAAGMSADDVLNSLRPPLFFKLRDRFKAELRTWRPRRVALALQALLEAELNAKRTGLPAEAVCRDALLRIARGAAPRRG